MSSIEREGDDLDLLGTSHRLSACPVDGTTWVGMIEVDSPTNSALLTLEDAEALRDWLSDMITKAGA